MSFRILDSDEIWLWAGFRADWIEQERKGKERKGKDSEYVRHGKQGMGGKRRCRE